MTPKRKITPTAPPQTHTYGLRVRRQGTTVRLPSVASVEHPELPDKAAGEPSASLHFQELSSTTLVERPTTLTETQPTTASGSVPSNPSQNANSAVTPTPPSGRTSKTAPQKAIKTGRTAPAKAAASKEIVQKTPVMEKVSANNPRATPPTPNAPASAANLARLPLELIFIITDYFHTCLGPSRCPLNTRDLFHLSRTCRQLHYFLLPRLRRLWANKTYNPVGWAVRERDMELLRGLLLEDGMSVEMGMVENIVKSGDWKTKEDLAVLDLLLEKAELGLEGSGREWREMIRGMAGVAGEQMQEEKAC